MTLSAGQGSHPCSKDISRQCLQGIAGKQPLSPLLQPADGVTIGLLQKGKVPGSSTLSKSCAKGDTEAEQQDARKAGGSCSAWSGLCSPGRGWGTSDRLAGNTAAFPEHQAASLVFCSQLAELSLREVVPSYLG